MPFFPSCMERKAGDLPSIAAYGLALLLGLGLALWLFPAHFLQGQARLYELGDFAQHLSGWQFYRDDDWRLPLLYTTRLNAPEGVSIAFTDSLPLLAIPFKLLSPWLPADFQYFALWHVLVILGQGLAGVFLIRSFGCRQWYAALAGAILALLAPTLPWRLGHSALLAHGLLLLMLGGYFRGLRDEWPHGRVAALLAIIALTGLLIHPYWLAMLFGVFMAFLIDDARTGSGWRIQFQRLALTLTALAGFLWLFGYGGSGLRAVGFGHFSMNLLAPVCGGRLTACQIDATGGQYEGFNYLGAGALLLVILALVLARRRRRRGVDGAADAGVPGLSLGQRHLGLCLYVLACTLYALSNRLYIGSWLMLDWPLPEAMAWATGIFRVSGRFFWPVGYLLVFGALAVVVRRTPPRQAVAMLALVLPLQGWDVAPYWQIMRQRLAEPPQDRFELWQELLRDTQQINLHPAFGCQEGDIDQYFFFQRLAAHWGLRMDTGYIARAAVDCAAKRRKFDQPFAPGQLYVLAAPLFSRSPEAVPAGFAAALAGGECARWQQALLCRVGMTPAAWPLFLQSNVQYLPEGRLQWDASDLYSVIGAVQAGELAPVNPETAGFLSYGPYVELSPGHYRAVLEYRSTLPADQPAGRWDAVAAPLKGGQVRIYGGGTLMGTVNAPGAVMAWFEIRAGDGPLEVRAIYPGRGDLRVQRLRVERAMPHDSPSAPGEVP